MAILLSLLLSLDMDGCHISDPHIPMRTPYACVYCVPGCPPDSAALRGAQSVEGPHAMRDAREGHSVTYLQSKEVPAGIHVRRAVVGYGGRDGRCCCS